MECNEDVTDEAECDTSNITNQVWWHRSSGVKTEGSCLFWNRQQVS